MSDSQLLKKDLIGEIRQTGTGDNCRIVRDAAAASSWIRWIARRLLRREANVLAALGDLDGVPHLIDIEQDRLTRSFLPGTPMHRARPRGAAVFFACWPTRTFAICLSTSAAIAHSA